MASSFVGSRFRTCLLFFCFDLIVPFAATICLCWKALVSLERVYREEKMQVSLVKEIRFLFFVLKFSSSASARYIFCGVGALTRQLVRPEDDALLTATEEDGESVQPSFYVPILPLVLINGQVRRCCCAVCVSSSSFFLCSGRGWHGLELQHPSSSSAARAGRCARQAGRQAAPTSARALVCRIQVRESMFCCLLLCLLLVVRGSESEDDLKPEMIQKLQGLRFLIHTSNYDFALSFSPLFSCFLVCSSCWVSWPLLLLLTSVFNQRLDRGRVGEQLRLARHRQADGSLYSARDGAAGGRLDPGLQGVS